ncbi:MAG: hypothetical protein ACJAXL_000842 [Alphaproteobacteria bacterium]|jgi:hypothetical protein
MHDDSNIDEAHTSSHKNVVDDIFNKITASTSQENNKDEETTQEFDASIDQAIDDLERILKIQALHDNEWSEIYEPEIEFHDDIQTLDFEVN